ncbi:MAG: GAF domain-containing sensor histidine kinase [Anaerolineaceae bacterium]|nr:GAF domain-containing sensor histidine kinase [Anaerolineaceae bacterium]
MQNKQNIPNDFFINNEKESLVYYQKFIEIFLDLASTFDLETILRKILTTAKELTSAEAGSILFYDDNRQSLYFAAMTNQSKEAQLHKMIVPKESLAGWVATNRVSVIVEDVHKDNRWFTNVSKKIDFPTKSIIAVPMIAQNHLIGVLEVLNKSQGKFNKQDEYFLNLLAAQAAVAIHNTRLFQQSDLISELVHEIRTPLGSINTIAYLLQRSEISPEQRISLSGTIQKEIERLNQMASNYLDFARLESGRIYFNAEIFNLKELLEECIDLINKGAEKEGIGLVINISSDLSDIEADQEKIKQVLLNLLNNAIKYNLKNGTVTISASNKGTDKVSIIVEDTGIGFSDDDLIHLFERFYRSKTAMEIADGTGLGLSICKQIVEAHAGTIDVKSTYSKGSQFIITLNTTL